MQQLLHINCFIVVCPQELTKSTLLGTDIEKPHRMKTKTALGSTETTHGPNTPGGALFSHASRQRPAMQEARATSRPRINQDGRDDDTEKNKHQARAPRPASEPGSVRAGGTSGAAASVLRACAAGAGRALSQAQATGENGPRGPLCPRNPPARV